MVVCGRHHALLRGGADPDGDERSPSSVSYMTLKEAVSKACEEPTLLDALTWIAVWESERVVQQARKIYERGVRTPDDSGWDTCFRVCFDSVMRAWKKKHKPINSECEA